MSSRNFWLICLKTLGMWLIINLFISLPNMIYNLIALFTTPDSGMNVTIGISNAVFVSVIYFLIFQFLILRSHRTIDFLKLDKAFEGIRVNLAIPYNRLLKIVILLIGGALLVNSIPNLVENIYLYLEDDLLFSQSLKTINIIIYSTLTIISLLIMTNTNVVRRYITKKQAVG